MEDISFLSYFLVRKAPVLLLAGAGIVFAIVRWKRHPRVSLVTVIGLVFLLGESFTISAVYYWLPSLFARRWASYDNVKIYYTVLAVLDDIAYALVILLLVVAALIQRNIQSTSKA